MEDFGAYPAVYVAGRGGKSEVLKLVSNGDVYALDTIGRKTDTGNVGLDFILLVVGAIRQLHHPDKEPGVKAHIFRIQRYNRFSDPIKLKALSSGKNLVNPLP